MRCPPADTRAAIRGLFVREYADSVRSIGWNGVAFERCGEDFLFDMNSLVGEETLPVVQSLDCASSFNEIIEILGRVRSGGAGAKE
jgi:hypothetical protein